MVLSDSGSEYLSVVVTAEEVWCCNSLSLVVEDPLLDLGTGACG